MGSPLTHARFLRRHKGTYGPGISAAGNQVRRIAALYQPLPSLRSAGTACCRPDTNMIHPPPPTPLYSPGAARTCPRTNVRVRVPSRPYHAVAGYSRAPLPQTAS